MSEVLSENELRDRIMLLGHELIDAEHFLKYANEIIESHKALQRRVEWTKVERNQVKPGFYWWRLYDDEPWQVVEVRIEGDRLFHVRCGSLIEIDSSKGEWAGPLEAPHEARG